MINQRYEIIGDFIGEGGFAKVYLAEDTRHSMLVALKRYDPSKFIAKIKSQSTGAKINAEKYSVLSEIKRGLGLTHPNIIRYYDAFTYEEKSSFGSEKYEVGVMEYLKDGDWSKFVEKYGANSKEFKQSLKGVLDGLKFLHSNNIIHRDIKPSNILFDGLTPKITDLGISKELTKGSAESSVLLGTVEYMSPEQISPTDFGINNQISFNTDLWSLGVVIYKLFLGKLPFGNTNSGIENEEIRKNIISDNYKIPDLDKIPQPYRVIIEKCLVRKATDRVRTVDQLNKLLYTEYIEDDDEGKDDNNDNGTNKNNDNKEVETDLIDRGNDNIKKEDPNNIDNDNIGNNGQNEESINIKKYLIYALSAFILIFAAFLAKQYLFDSDTAKTTGKTKTNTNTTTNNNTYNIAKESKSLDYYFKEILDSDLDSNAKYNVYEKHKKSINNLFTKDAKIKLVGSGLYNVNDFFIKSITSGKTVDSFIIKGHQNGKISYIEVKQ